MPAPTLTDHYGLIVWLGRLARPVERDLIIRGEPLTEMDLTFAGFASEVHAGLTRPWWGRMPLSAE